MSYTQTSGITLDFDRWIEEREKLENTNGPNWVRDINGLRYLDHRCHLSGFMTGPIAQYRGIHVQANSVSFDSLDDFILLCEDAVGERHIFLYDLWYNIGLPRYYGDPSPVTFELEFLDKPIEHITNGWKIRYGHT